MLAQPSDGVRCAPSHSHTKPRYTGHRLTLAAAESAEKYFGLGQKRIPDDKISSYVTTSEQS